MSTLRESLDALLDLQKIDTERDQITRRLRNFDTGQQIATEAKQASDAAAAARTELQHATTSLRDAELELAGLEKKLKTYEDRVRSGSVSNPRELMNTEKEIGQLVRQRSALDDRILGLMEETETLRVKTAQMDAAATESEQRRKTHFDTLAAERARLEHALADLNTRRVESADLVPDKALLKRYETIKARPASAGTAIGRTQDNVCGGCHTQVSSIAARHALEGDQLVTCENCGRIMA